MPVRFRFRSSLAFDSVDLGGRSCISVRDLRALILRHIHLQLPADSHLLISDASSGSAFEDEELLIPDGSGVIIKRVPAGEHHIRDTVGVGETIQKDGFVDRIARFPLENADMDKCDEFGGDLYPTLEASAPESDADVGYESSSEKKTDDVVSGRCWQHPSRCQKAQNNVKSDIRKIKVECNIEDNEKERKMKTDEQKKLDGGDGRPSPVLNSEPPTELRCSLCNAIYLEAVMIPCCQHSFCDKCIRLALAERVRCPRCYSTKCTVDDLLPNLSLRQAIEHFLQAQLAIDGVDCFAPRYVPDGESGIQVKEVSCAMSVYKKELPCPQSPSATGRGSNQVMPEFADEKRVSTGIGSSALHLVADKSGPSSILKLKQNEAGGNNSSDALEEMAGCHGNNSSSKLPQNRLQQQDGSGHFLPRNKYRKVDRTCFMCGSPNHLIRDCPAGSGSYPLNQTGDVAFARGMQAYGQSYWHGAPFTHVAPYPNIYSTAGMMSFDPTVMPVAPFGFPSYMPSMYSGMPMHYGFTRMEGMHPPIVATAKGPLTRADFMDPQDDERKHKHFNEQLESERDCDTMSGDYHYDEAQRRCHDKKEKSATRSCSDNHSQRMHKKRTRDECYDSLSSRRTGFTSDEELNSVDQKHERGPHVSGLRRVVRTHYSGKSNSEECLTETFNWRRGERKGQGRESSSGKQRERKARAGGDGSRSHHRSHRETSDERENCAKVNRRRDFRQQSHLDTGLKVNPTYDYRHGKEKESSHDSRHSRHNLKHTNDRLGDDRWEMAVDSNGTYRGGSRSHIKKRLH